LSGFVFVDGPREQQAVANWVSARLGLDPFEKFHAIGIGREGKPVAGIVFHDFFERPHGNLISVSVAAETPDWATRRNLARLLDYPFNVAGCCRVTSTVAANNHRAIRFNLGIGFRKEGEVRNGYDGKTNLLVLGMLKNECRWLRYGQRKEKDDGKRFKQSSAAA
jgi:RimJ/RimL family protein N-acetyltransferase